jgi:galactokinase
MSLPSSPSPTAGESRERLIRRQFRERFGRESEVLTRAPGRVEVVGNHTDYNGGAVVGAAINRHVWVAAARTASGAEPRWGSGLDGIVHTVPWRFSASGAAERNGRGGEGGAPVGWTRYVAAVARSVAEHGYAVPEGVDLWVESDLPVGAGLSSSAALELAAALAFLELGRAGVGGAVAPEALARLCQHAENRYVGMPCGILDQATSALGAPDAWVWIDCRGPEFRRLAVPADLRLWVFDTGEKHALVDGLYATRHRECQEAATKLGVDQLCRLSPAALLERLPTLGAPWAARARHVVEEHARVAAVVQALAAGDLRAVGEQMFASHESSRVLFENSTPALDALVDALRGRPHVWGARLTGGGFGGAVLAVTDSTFTATDAAAVVAEVCDRHGFTPHVLPLTMAGGATVI